MRPEERDLAYIWDMREAADEVIGFVRGVGLEDYSKNKILRRAVERQIEIIGEAARHVSNLFQEKHPEIPWRQIIGLRNILVHDYGEVQTERVFRVAVERIPELLEKLKPLIP